MTREIILDTETTGLDPASGHRVVEIGALELINHVPTGRTYHVYLNPERDMPSEAQAIHGLTSAFLADKPTFAAVVDDFIAFLGDSTLVIHNAGFDVGFLNAELGYVGKPPITPERIIDSLHIARQKHPGSANSLDALCRRYGIDNTRRTKHGALLDSELLAEVYLELIGGRQVALRLDSAKLKPATVVKYEGTARVRSAPLSSRLTEDERRAHRAFVEDIGEHALWNQSLN
jgi:DNA polymerase-3 subunit epsilon